MNTTTLAKSLYRDLKANEDSYEFLHAQSYAIMHYEDKRHISFVQEGHDFKVKIIGFIDGSFLVYRMKGNRVYPMSHGKAGREYFKNINTLAAVLESTCLS